MFDSRDKSQVGKTHNQGVPFGSSKWQERRAVEATFVVCCTSPQPLKILKSQQKRNTEPSPAVDADGVVDDSLKENGTGGESVNPRPRVVGEEKVDLPQFTYRAGPCECDSTNQSAALSHPKLLASTTPPILVACNLSDIRILGCADLPSNRVWVSLGRSM